MKSLGRGTGVAILLHSRIEHTLIYLASSRIHVTTRRLMIAQRHSKCVRVQKRLNTRAGQLSDTSLDCPCTTLGRPRGSDDVTQERTKSTKTFRNHRATDRSTRSPGRRRGRPYPADCVSEEAVLGAFCLEGYSERARHSLWVGLCVSALISALHMLAEGEGLNCRRPFRMSKLRTDEPLKPLESPKVLGRGTYQVHLSRDGP